MTAFGFVRPRDCCGVLLLIVAGGLGGCDAGETESTSIKLVGVQDHGGANTQAMIHLVVDEGEEADRVAPVDFSREILPLLSNSCFHCHGPDRESEQAQDAGFRLDDRDDAIVMDAIVPGDAQASLMMDVLTTARASRMMPPPDSGKPALTADQVETIRRWIDQGAGYTSHWSFEKPALSRLPAVSDAGWCRSAMDYFVLAALDDAGLSPSHQAGRRRLIRRLSLDLTGLPPTPQQVQAFVIDDRADAYERVVDALLASPRFGEHWARQWLDNARYADSQGFEKDRPRTMWRYRDWVISAYNADMPFDQFTREQIAGDLLPEPTLDQLIATGFHRNTQTNTEGGTDDEEFRSAAVIDRVNTTMAVWMGMTMNCAQCHTHKYDPIYHEEYYRLYAFFNQTADADHDNDRPLIKAPTSEQRQRIDAIKQQLQALRDSSPAQETPEPASTPGEIESLESQLEQAQDAVPTALVMRDLPVDKRRQTHLFLGGSFLAPDLERGELAPGVPEALHPFPQDAPTDRLGLAQWLIHDDNPLTARVQVNRIWEQLFGVGLVQTTNDFGFQGSYPANKDLLDHLAYTYQHELQWSTKDLIKLIVMSAAYRQTSAVDAGLLEIDPYNRLISRGPRLRLSAEQVRDQAMYVSGLLVEQVGGPSVMPYIPQGMLPQAFDTFVQQASDGDALHRRGIYTAWRRTGHYPSFAVFDAPSREICTIKRSITNTPLQAFVTLNDPVYVEAAQAFARLLIGQAGDDFDARVNLAFNRALARDASPEEVAVLKQAYTQALARYQQDAQAAMQIATDPHGPLPRGMDVADAAAMTVVCNVILNLDEFLTKP